MSMQNSAERLSEKKKKGGVEEKRENEGEGCKAGGGESRSPSDRYHGSRYLQQC